MSRIAVITVLLVVLSSLCSAQRRLDVVLDGGGGLSRMRLDSLQRDTVFVSMIDTAGAFYVGDIREIGLHGFGNHAATGAGIGVGAGLVTGVVWHLGEGGSLLDFFGSENDDGGSKTWRVLVAALGGGILGGAIGYLIPKNEIVSFSGLGIEMRVAEIRRLIRD